MDRSDFIFEDHRADSAFIHESTYIDSPCHIGENTTVMHFVHIMPHSVIGHHCHIGHHATISSGVLIGNHVRVMNHALLNSGVILEDGVYCGPATVFCPADRLRGKGRALSRISPTLVRRGASVGAHSSVASGVTIGQHTFVEAGTLIDRNVPDFALVCGNPLKFAGWRCECGELLRFDDDHTQCHLCHKAYIRQSRHRIIQVQSRQTIKRQSQT